MGAIALLALAATGCGESGSSRSNDGSSGAELRAKADEIAASLDIDTTVLRGLNGLALHARLTNDCIRRGGVDLPPAPPLPVDPPIAEISDLDLWLNRGKPLGLGSALGDPRQLQQQRDLLEQRSAFEDPGYPPGAEKLLEGDPPETIEIPLPGGHGGSVTIPVGGCFGDATEELYGVPAEKYERTRLALPRLDDVMSEALSEGGVEDLSSEYGSCMQSRGLEARTPGDLQETLSQMYSDVLGGKQQPSALAQLERRAVVADWNCKQVSGLDAAFAKAFVEKGRAALRATEGVVVEYRAMIEHARSVAERLSSSP